MDPVYPRFAAANAEFYDDPRRNRRPGALPFVASSRLDWREWSHSSDGHWTYRAPVGNSIPEQGWKVHVSTTGGHAREVLDLVSAHCHARSISFKHLANDDVLRAMNSKDADRTASGKFITLYPTATDLRDTLDELERLLTGRAGPHILTDLRWRKAPVFVRYGAFQRLFTDVDGFPTLALRDPNGLLVPDIRRASFHLPSWVELPDFLIDSLTAQTTGAAPAGFPIVTRALQQSNAGGVYEATDAGKAVALKEARPHAGLTPDGRTAVERLVDEAAVLDQIDSTRVVRAIRSFDVLDHFYLVTERIEGLPLSKAIISRHPLIQSQPRDDDVRTFRDWALDLAESVEVAVSAVHASGHTHGDLHPGNFIVRDNGDVVLIDLEMARPISANAPGVIGAPGFVALDGRRGLALDRYALGCIKLFMFLPLTPLLDLDVGKARQLVSWARERFDLPSRWVESVVADIGSDAELTTLTSPPPSLDAHIRLLISQLLTDATPEREDRLWPTDPAGVDEPAYGIAHGALGPLLALHEAGAHIPDTFLDWVDHAMNASRDPRLGLMDGLAGAAVAFRHMGRASASDDVLERLAMQSLDAVETHLYGGLAGIGMAYAHLTDARTPLLGPALNIVDRLSQHRKSWRRRPAGPVATGAAGLMRGPSGVALFALALYDRTGDRCLLELAEDGIRADLSACIHGPDGALLVDEGWRTLPYLGSGSAGIAYSLAALLKRSPGCGLRNELDALILATQTEFVLESGLLQGRAGLMTLLAQLSASGLGTTASAESLTRHLNLLWLHALPRAQGIGYPGRALLRRSCDLATGSAGVLLTLVGLRTHHTSLGFPLDAPFPFLGSRDERG